MGILDGKRGVVMGVANDHSIAWGIAQKLADQGADLCFTYQGEALLRRIKPLAESINNNFILECDVLDSDSIKNTFSQIKDKWKTIDFVLHSIAFSDKNELKGKYINSTRENFFKYNAYFMLFFYRNSKRSISSDEQWWVYGYFNI